MIRNKLFIDKGRLKKLYLNEKKSTCEIAKIFGCNQETIRRRLIDHGILRRYREIKIKIPSEDLKNLYLKDKMSTLELAKKYKCSQWTIRSKLIKKGVLLRSSSAFLKWKSPGNQLKPDLGESPSLAYIIGVFLGDAWIYKCNHNYSIGLDTIEYKFAKSFYDSLKEIGLNPNLFPRKGRYWRVIATSKIFYHWADNLNYRKIKRITQEFFKDFLRGIYESEGCLGINFDKRSGKKYLLITIVSCEKDTIDLTKLFIEKMGLHPRLNLRRPKPPRKEIWALNLGKQREIIKFIDIIKPIIKNKNITFINQDNELVVQ